MEIQIRRIQKILIKQKVKKNNFIIDLKADDAEDWEEDEKNNLKNKLIKDIVSNNDIINILDNNNNGNKTLMINSESVSKIIEQNAISVKWCKLCNVIVNNFFLIDKIYI